MSKGSVRIELTSRQVELLLEYSCPFEKEEGQLNKLQNRKGDFHVLISNDFYAPLLIGDIVHYAKEIDDEYLLDELDELAEIISMAISATKSTPV
jgi:hypothetical protein